MHFPFGAGLIARIREQRRERAAQAGLLAHYGFVGGIGDHATFIAVQPGHNSGAGRNADGAAGIAAAVAGSHGGHIIQMRRKNVGVAPGVDSVKALLVCGYQQNIGLRHR
ncbi:hypothetical protein HMPREF1548_03131 [Clostridium sp. KLE 1755]|nr:hypothetical protein HMPREF1548_03131 [Clostridium sp. KLE 1755]